MIKLPELFENRIKKLLLNEYEEFKSCYNKSYAGGIRVNTLKAEPSELANKCPFELKRIPYIKKGFYYTDECKPSKHPYYYAGLYYIQEPSAMTPASLLRVMPGDKVLDLCAAPGGKSTELGAELDGKGILVSNDISNSRAKALLKNIEMFGIKNAVVVSESPVKLSKVFESWFDKILVDAPCSGEGMFRKSPSIMKNWEKHGVDYYNKLQKEILPYAVNMLKPGGYLLYSTCTFSPEEDEEIVAWLLKEYPMLKLVPVLMDKEGVDYSGFEHGRADWINADMQGDRVENINYCVRLWPHKINGEGHFIALFKKDEDKELKTLNKDQMLIQNKNETKELSISDEAREFLLKIKMPIDFNHIMIKENRLYILPDTLIELKGLRILRSGLLLGEQKKDRFEPSQALANALKSFEYDNIYNLEASDDDVIRYLKCESIELKKEVQPGLVLVCVDGYPLGWGKSLNGHMLKNKYLPGWRMM